MRYIISFLSLFFLCNQLYSQKDSLLLNITIKDHIKTDSDFIANIKLVSIYSYPIRIFNKPLFTNYESKYGNVLFKLERLEDKCFVGIDIDMDPFGIEFDTSKRYLLPGDTISIKYDINRIYFLGKGIYRIKAYFDYSKFGKFNRTSSDWIYFDVSYDKFFPNRNKH